VDYAALSPFYVKDCALAAIATGMKVRSLIELRDKLQVIPPSSIYFHFWGGRLRTSFEHYEYHNDFSSWVHYHLHDDVLAERLELLNPHEFADIEELRAELIELIDDRLDEREVIPWVKSDEQFHFIDSKIVIFQTRHQINVPEELIQVLPLLTRSSLFYHVIDAARRTANHMDDFCEWLGGHQERYRELIDALHRIDPYPISLGHLQKKMLEVAKEYFLR
jgi:hypothetical protein